MSAPSTYPVDTKYGVPGRLWAAGHHTGVDYRCPTGSRIVAPKDSLIIHAGTGGWGAAYGIHVIGETVEGGRTYRWIVAHLKKTAVLTGARVHEGTLVGLSNSTGNVTGPHCHFEVRTAPYRYGDDVNPAVLTKPARKYVGSYRLVHANINQYMSAAAIRADVHTLFSENPDAFTVNEAVTVTRTEIRKEAVVEGYSIFAGPGGLNQLVTGLSRSSITEVSTWVKKAVKGISGLSPERGTTSVLGRHIATKATISTVNWHADSKAWTTNDKKTKLRKARWYAEYAVLVARVKWLTARRDIVTLSGDANRPLGSWPGKQPFPALTTSKWAKAQKTHLVVQTGPTYGKARYDYVVVLSRRLDVEPHDVSTFSLKSDHDGISVDLRW